MSDSLQEQLRALGLVKKKSAGRKKAGGKRPRGKADKRRGGKSAGGEPSLDEAYRLRAREERRAAERKKEEKRLRDLERRRINKQVQDIVEAHALNDKAAELKRNFMYKGRIRSVLCTPEQLRAVNAGDLGVAFLRGSYYLLAPEHVEAVRVISPDHVPDLGGPDQDDPDDDDEYKVPDDLIW